VVWKKLGNPEQNEVHRLPSPSRICNPIVLGMAVGEGGGRGREEERRFLLGIDSSCGYLASFFLYFLIRSLVSYFSFFHWAFLRVLISFMLACFLLCLLICADGQLSLAALPFASHLGLESGVRRLRFCLGHGTRTRTAETGGAKLKIAATVPVLFFQFFFYHFPSTMPSGLWSGSLPISISLCPLPILSLSLCFYFLSLDQILFSFFSFLFFSFCWGAHSP